MTMANELRSRQNFQIGTLTTLLTAGGATLDSAELLLFQAIDTTSHAAISLDPFGLDGEPEIVWVIDHPAASMTATIIRGRENTIAREHSAGTRWVHAPTVLDVGPKEYVHNQVSPIALWTVNHYLGFRPSVFVVDSAGTEVIGDVEHVSTSTLTIEFASAFAGTAYVS